MFSNYVEEVLSSRYELEEECDQGFLYGRFNPPSSHHAAMVEYVAEEYNLDEVTLGIVRSNGTSRSPMVPEQIEEAFYINMESVDPDFEFNTFIHEINDFDSFMWGDIDELSEGALCYTGDAKHALLTEAREKYTGKDLNVVYEPRNQQEFTAGDRLPKSGTEVRQAIKRDEGWRDLMPLGTQQIIDENPEIFDKINEGNPSGPGKHFEILFR